MSKKQLLDYVRNLVSLTSEETERFLSAFNEVDIKKGQLIIQPGFTNEHRSFVIKGVFRSYSVSGNSQEHTLQFAIENCWALDFNSYIYRQPATLFIIALEDSSILQIDFESEQEFKRDNYKFEALFRKIAEEGLSFEQSRILFFLKYEPEARYENFLLYYPNLVQRVPQSTLLSYLGISSEFLLRFK